MSNRTEQKTEFDKVINLFYAANFKRLHIPELEAVIYFNNWLKDRNIKILVRKNRGRAKELLRDF